MVSKVSRIQCSVRRMAMARATVPIHLAGKFKPFFCLFIVLNTEHYIMKSADARDLGTHGVTYPIEEEDPIALIQQKLKVMEDNGELKKHNLELQKRTRASVERPKPVEGITKATKSRIFYYDPTYVVKEDLRDHQGRIFARKESRINPLETVSLSQKLILFDGDDEEQLTWVKEQLAKATETHSLRLILVGGAPLKLAEQLKIPVYFDQSGILTQKLGIKHMPVVVSQEGLRLRIEEIELPPSQELIVEGGL